MIKAVSVHKKRNKFRLSVSRKIFLVVNGLALIGFAVLCLLPFINLFSVSLSSKNAVNAGLVSFFPVDITLNAYQYLLKQSAFFAAFWMSIKRVFIGTAISMVVIIFAAYPLSLSSEELPGKRFYIVICVISMFFSGGLIPTYIVITNLGLYNTIWALVLPSAMNCWNMVLMLNFIRRVPKELSEYAQIEGAGYFTLLLKIILPVSLPAVATVLLFTVVGHWNAWFDGYIYMSSENWPLQTYIYNILDSLKQLQASLNKTEEDLALLSKLDDKTLRSAQIFIAMLPIMMIYPFAQKYFVQGLMLGSVKE